MWMSSTVSQLWLGQVVAGTRTNQCRIVAFGSAQRHLFSLTRHEKNFQIDHFGENLHALFCCMCPLQEKSFGASDANTPADFGGVAAKALRIVERTTLQSPSWSVTLCDAAKTCSVGREQAGTDDLLCRAPHCSIRRDVTHHPVSCHPWRGGRQKNP